MKIDAKLTMLVGEDGARIEIRDEASSITFVRINVKPDQFMAALGRLCNVDCDVAEVFGLDNLGKKLEVSELVIELPESTDFHSRKQVAKMIAKEKCPDGWVSDGYFSSQNSFFRRGAKEFARTTIRTWV